ncbi:MAG: GIY-YIG nuclease family protein [Cyclobacteriaceae bacterium]
MYYLYLLYSPSSDKYYVGYSTDPFRRLHEHNSTERNTFTSRFRPWKLVALFACGEHEKDAVKLERFIKRQKSRQLLERLANPDFVPEAKLAHPDPDSYRDGRLESRMCGINQRVVPIRPSPQQLRKTYV